MPDHDIGAPVRARIGIAETDKTVEIDVDDVKAFKKEVERALTDGGMAWFIDAKGRSVGIPAKNVAFVEVDDAGTTSKVGFGPGC